MNQSFNQRTTATTRQLFQFVSRCPLDCESLTDDRRWCWHL